MKKPYCNAERTRKMIRQAFAALLAEKRTMENITVSELTCRADIAKSTFYNHYVDIYAVAAEFENELLTMLFSSIDEADRSAMPMYEVHMRRLLDFLGEHDALYRSALLSPDTRYFVEKLKIMLARHLASTYTFPFSADPVKRQIQINFFTNACVDTLCDYYRGAFTASLEEVGGVIIELLQRATLSTS